MRVGSDGLRRSDAVRLGRQHIQGDFIVIHTKKSGEDTEEDEGVTFLSLTIFQTDAQHQI